jgi:nitrate/nitrite transporter NarK
MGYMTERIGARKTGLVGMVATLLPLLMAWQFASTFTGFLACGIMLGVAGASFAAALPLASAWYPPEYQGARDGNRWGGKLGYAGGNLVRAATRAGVQMVEGLCHGRWRRMHRSGVP